MTRKDGRGVVLLAGWYYPDSVGGTEAYVHWLAKDLQRLGCDVVVGAPSVDNLERRYQYDGVRVYRYPVEPNPGLAEVRGEIPPEHFEVFAKWLEEEQPRLVHLHSLTRGCGFFHGHLAKALGLPVVITIHVPGFVCPRGTMMRWGTTPCDGQMRTHRCAACALQAHGVPRAVSWPLSLASGWTGAWAVGRSGRVAAALTIAERTATRHTRVRELLRLADRVVVVSQWLQSVLHRNAVDPRKVVLVRHGLSDEYLRASRTASTRSGSGRLRVGYVGRIHPVKGLRLLVSALKAVPSARPIELHIYGTARSAEEQQYLSAVRVLAAGDNRITFHGELAGTNRADAFRSLDILAVPSLWLETGPLVVLEAFAAGLPVLGSNTGGIAELVTDCVSGRLVEAGSITAWARALRELSEQSMAGRWVWSVPRVRSSREVAEDMLKIYREVSEFCS